MYLGASGLGILMQPLKTWLDCPKVGTAMAGVGYCCDRPALVRGTLWEELWVRKFIERLKLGEMFLGSLEENDVERSADHGGLSCDVSEGSLRVQDYQSHCVFAIMSEDSMALVS